MRRWEFMKICTSPKAHAVYRPAELHSAMCVATHIDDRRPGVFPYPSVATLARETGFDRSTVIRHLNRLCGGPWPLFQRHVTPGKPTRYQPVASRTLATGTSPPGATGTSRAPATSTSRTGSPTSRTSAPNPSHQRDTNLVEQSINSLSEPDGERDTPDGVPEPEGFIRAWKSYPARRRTGKAKALEVWTRRGLEQLTDGVLARIEYMTRTEWVAEDGRFAPKFPAFLEDVAPSEAPPQPDAAGDWQNPEARRQWSESGTAIASMAEAAGRQQGLGGRVEWLEETRLMLASWGSREPLEADVDLAKIIVEVFADEVAEGAAV